MLPQKAHKVIPWKLASGREAPIGQALNCFPRPLLPHPTGMYNTVFVYSDWKHTVIILSQNKFGYVFCVHGFYTSD